MTPAKTRLQSHGELRRGQRKLLHISDCLAIIILSFDFKMCCVDREDSLMMHKESPPSKNCFLEDLDKLDVSFHS